MKNTHYTSRHSSQTDNESCQRRRLVKRRCCRRQEEEPSKFPKTERLEFYTRNDQIPPVPAHEKTTLLISLYKVEVGVTHPRPTSPTRVGIGPSIRAAYRAVDPATAPPIASADWRSPLGCIGQGQNEEDRRSSQNQYGRLSHFGWLDGLMPHYVQSGLINLFCFFHLMQIYPHLAPFTLVR